MLHVVPPTNQTCLATNQVTGYKTLLQNVEYFYFCQYNLFMLRFLPAQDKPVLQQDRFERRWYNA